MNSIILAACSNDKVNKWLSEMLDEINLMPATDEFEQATRTAYNAMLLNRGLPNYDGKGKGSPKANINALTTDQNKKFQNWEAKLLWGRWSQQRHLHHREVQETPQPQSSWIDGGIFRRKGQ